MFFDALINLIESNMMLIIQAIILSVLAISSFLTVLVIFRNGAKKVLNIVSGYDDRPKVGMRYGECDENGNFVHRVWTKKDQYYRDKSRRGN